MKKTFLNVFVAAALTLGFATLTSCGSDDPVVVKPGSNDSDVIKNLKSGVINGELAEDFTLDAKTAYKLTGKFSVKNGAKLTIPAGTNIEATAGGTEVYIAVEQGAKIDIQGTQAAPVVMASANSKPGDWGGLTILGNATTTAGVDATAEVGGFKYGGTDDADNSGSIKHLVIKGTGAQIDPESQYNGISFYAVGSGTVVENVAVINGADDGVEFFGGTVSVKNLYLENNQDDSIDWTEGWNGTVENAYISHTEAFSTAFEGDKDNKNPKFVNITAVSTVGGTALQFKKESGATITGLSLTGYDTTIDMKNDGPLANVKIDGANADPAKSYNAPATVSADDFAWIGNINTASTGELKGDLTQDLTLDPSKVYNLTGAYKIKKGATLTIPAGTRINATSGGTEVYIAVEKGAKIDIQGTAGQPVIMTSDTAKPGDWGGLTILGDATTTAGVDATAEVGGFKYGGTNDADNSGSIKYLIIQGTGAQIDPESQYNGISFYAVGSGTTVENVAVINGADDGVEFFGGSVSVKNLYLENNQDDSIDWTEGWNGTVENAYISHTEAGFSTAFEGDKDNKNPKFKNITAVSTVGGTALQFKKESGATITGLSLTGYDKTIDMKNDGALSNVKIDGADADPAKSYNAPATVKADDFAWIANINNASTAELKGDLTESLTLDANTVYNLTGAYKVKAGVTLTIPAGTRINATSGGTEVYIAVEKGGKIDIQGTADHPVVMTSDTAKPGDWGGLTILGDATTTAGVDATAEVGGFKYGGTNDADSSGSIKYLVIKGTGAQIDPESQYNGISFYAVGSGTTVENIAVINGADDGVEFFGGAVSAKNIYLENNQDDSVDWTEGWSGTLENVYISHTEAGFSTAFEGDKDNKNPKFINVTAISTVEGTALQFKKQSGGTFTNLYLDGYAKNIDMKNDGPLANVIIEGKEATLDGTYKKGMIDIKTWGEWFKK